MSDAGRDKEPSSSPAGATPRTPAPSSSSAGPSGGAAPDKRGEGLRLVAQYSGLAVTLPAAALIGFFIGAVLDHHWHTDPLWTIVFLLFGSAAGIAEVIRVISRNG